MNDSFGSGKDKKRKLIWAVLFVVIAALSVFAVSSAVKGFSLSAVLELLRGADPLWIVFALASMLGFIFFEAMAIRTLVRSFGHPCSIKDGVLFGAADTYFSAITPSATGGQPASAYFMVRSGIPSSCATVSLVFNLALYTLAILVIGIVTIIAMPSAYMFFRPAARVLIVLGAITLIGMAVIFVLIAIKRSFINRTGRILIGIGCRLRILRDRLKWVRRLEKWLEDYMRYAASIKNHKPAIIKALIFNILQRLCQLAVTMFMYIAVSVHASGLPYTQVIKNGVRLLGAQSLISIGSTYIPIPGAMGYTDLMMLDGFSTLMPEAQAAGLELLSRFVSFYLCVIICFIIVVIALLSARKDEKDEE
ncbi:MAG: flippase-like domain-containing protein [Firmicutes bacterium]|nr:flippase-like domain-containing protein [Bacillota bacterium]